MTPKDNANAHQQVFDGMYNNVDLALHLARIRSLTPEIGVVHIEGYKHAKGKPDERQGEMMITAVVQKISNRLENRRLPEYSGGAVRRGTDEVERITTAKGALSITSGTDPNVGVEDPSSPRTGRSYPKSFCPYAANEK